MRNFIPVIMSSNYSSDDGEFSDSDTYIDEVYDSDASFDSNASSEEDVAFGVANMQSVATIPETSGSRCLLHPRPAQSASHRNPVMIILNKADECSVCLLMYDEGECRPHILPCGYSLCSTCIDTLMKNGHLSCPHCHKCHPLDHFPINYALETAVKLLTPQNQEMDAVMVQEPNAVMTALSTMRQAVGTVSMAIGTITTALDTITAALENMTEQLFSTRPILVCNRNAPPAALDSNVHAPQLTSLISLNKEHPVLSIEELRQMGEPIRRLLESGVVAIQEHAGRLTRASLSRPRSAKITLENDLVYLHCLHNQPPPPNVPTVPLSDLLGGLDLTSTLAFLDVGWGGSTKGRVHIRLGPNTALSRLFMLLCTGQQGYSYRNTAFLSVHQKGRLGEGVCGGDYEFNNGWGGRELDPLPCDLEGFRLSGKAGVVWPQYFGYPDGERRAAQFIITTRDDPNGQLQAQVFGDVESGLGVLKAAANLSDITQATVVDCGLVLNR